MSHSDGMQSKGPLRLNFDALRLVCNCLTDVSDVLSFALTCSTLKNDAIQRRLRMSPIVLSNAEVVDKFHSFISADPAARAPHIYGLKLPNFSYTDATKQISDHLVAILEGAIHLEYLHLSIVGVENHLLATITKTSTLRELVVYGSYHRGPLLNLLTTLRCPLRYLCIKEYTTGDISADFLHRRLSHFAPTLEVLELADFSIDISPSSVTSPFTAMRSFKTELIYNFDHLGILLRLFPNLDDTLSLEALSANGTDFPALRERSKEAQKICIWQGLNRVFCNTRAAFLLALECPVRHMDLDGPLSSPEETRYLVETLRHNSPRQLSFRLNVFDGLRTLDGLFPVEAADKLTHLVVFLSFQVECRLGGTYDTDSNVPWAQFIDALIESMRHLRLTHLRIVLMYEVCREKDAPGPDDEEESVYIVGEQDLHPVAARFFNAMSALQCMLMTTCGYTSLLDGYQQHCGCASKRYSSKAWRVLDGNDGRLRPSDTEWGPCAEISGDEAAEAGIIDREELHLGGREQATLLFCRDSPSG